jgi:hypothetical protein
MQGRIAEEKSEAILSAYFSGHILKAGRGEKLHSGVFMTANITTEKDELCGH